MARLYDSEFVPEVLRKLKEREILGRANFAHVAVLDYNVRTKVKALEQEFQEARSANPLLETTPPEAWLTARIVPWIQQIRCNVDIEEKLLTEVVQKYLRCHVRPEPASKGDSEERLHRTVEHYLDVLETLLLNLFDRRKSLRGILRLSPGTYTIRKALSLRRPASRREEIFQQGIQDNWSNHRIAKELDDQGLKPRRKDHKSYKDMLRNSPQVFYSLKSSIKQKYL